MTQANPKVNQVLVITSLVTLLLMGVNAFLTISEVHLNTITKLAVIPLGLSLLLQLVLYELNHRPKLQRVWIVVANILLLYGVMFMFW